MSVFSKADSGTSFRGSRFPRIKDRTILDCDYGIGYPVFGRFCLPGDIWRITANVFTRFQPMQSPCLTRNYGRLRFFFVNLRQVEKDTEKVVTGSKEGYFDTSFMSQKFDDIFEHVDRKSSTQTSYTVEKGSFADVFFGIPAGTYNAQTVRGKKSSPASYWYDAYMKIYWDYYRDENLSVPNVQGDFDAYINSQWANQSIFKAPTSSTSYLFPVCLRKDYFTKALPWQLKGIAPTISASQTSAVFSGKFFDSRPATAMAGLGPAHMTNAGVSTIAAPLVVEDTYGSDLNNANGNFLEQLNKNTVQSSISFNAADFRAMMAQTRVFERMARCGSRYTEYLRSNFGTAPADETLQRPKYLGGMKFDILVTEIEQNAADGANPVGTLRGHGIGNANTGISTFRANEFGMIFGILDFSVDTQYTQGVDREFSYKSRTDFFNPSFQHLSEQEVRGAEVFFSGDGFNDNVFGYQAYANELRSGKQKIVGDMRDTLSYWQQGIDFTSRPNLNYAFISAFYKRASYRKPFVVQQLGSSTNPLIVDCLFNSDVYRPMARYGTPGLVDHL